MGDHMRRWPEISLIVGGLILIGASVAVMIDRYTYQRDQELKLERELARTHGRKDRSLAARPPAKKLPADASATAAAARPTARRSQLKDAIGRLEIPRIDLTVMIGEGIEKRTLDRAVGHVIGTALPGEPGNVALAGHRDTFFRRLGQLRNGDRIRITSRS